MVGHGDCRASGLVVQLVFKRRVCFRVAFAATIPNNFFLPLPKVVEGICASLGQPERGIPDRISLSNLTARDRNLVLLALVFQLLMDGDHPVGKRVAFFRLATLKTAVRLADEVGSDVARTRLIGVLGICVVPWICHAHLPPVTAALIQS